MSIEELKSFKKVYDIFTGIVATAPEIKYFENGKAKCTFSIPLRSGEDTFWLNCECWGNRAEFAAERLKKGDEITIMGYFKESEYNGKTNVIFNVKGIC